MKEKRNQPCRSETGVLHCGEGGNGSDGDDAEDNSCPAALGACGTRGPDVGVGEGGVLVDGNSSSHGSVGCGGDERRARDTGQRGKG